MTWQPKVRQVGRYRWEWRIDQPPLPNEDFDLFTHPAWGTRPTRKGAERAARRVARRQNRADQREHTMWQPLGTDAPPP